MLLFSGFRMIYENPGYREPAINHIAVGSPPTMEITHKFDVYNNYLLESKLNFNN